MVLLILMSLKESKESYMGKIEGRKWKEEKNIIILVKEIRK